VKKKKENILTCIIFVGFIAHFVVGYFFWDKIGIENLYRLTGYFCMDLWGFIVFLLANTRWLKGMGALGMILGSYYSYILLQDEDVKDYFMFGVMLSNVFFIWFFIEKFKQQKR